MPDNDIQNQKMISNDDPLDINELALLNDDISAEFIEQLQSKVEQSANALTPKNVSSESDDTELFEEVKDTPEKPSPKAETQTVSINDSVDDNFIKKYRAKLSKQQNSVMEEPENKKPVPKVVADEIEGELPSISGLQPEAQKGLVEAENKENKENKDKQDNNENHENHEIENITNGNIIEKPIQEEQISYSETLDYADNNVKYDKYVIYIDPENKEFIESLTVKERKNLINRILREQDNIAVTQKRLVLMQTVIKHIVIAVLTLSVSVPIIYWTINASLEASINNYRKSQTLFQTLYKENGKIKNKISN